MALYSPRGRRKIKIYDCSNCRFEDREDCDCSPPEKISGFPSGWKVKGAYVPTGETRRKPVFSIPVEES